jgi:hypothetical protein
LGIQKGIKGSPLDPQVGAYNTSSLGSPYFPILSGSRLIDAGNPNGCLDEDAVILINDQHGEARTKAYACDLGASESFFSSIRNYLPFIIR